MGLCVIHSGLLVSGEMRQGRKAKSVSQKKKNSNNKEKKYCVQQRGEHWVEFLLGTHTASGSVTRGIPIS